MAKAKKAAKAAAKVLVDVNDPLHPQSTRKRVRDVPVKRSANGSSTNCGRGTKAQNRPCKGGFSRLTIHQQEWSIYRNCVNLCGKQRALGQDE